VVLDHEGDQWSWDKGRIATIQYKRTLSDCAVDGNIPQTVRISETEMLKRGLEALDQWIERIGEDGVLSIERERLTVPLPPDIRRKAQMRHGDFTNLNNRWSTSRSTTTHSRLKEDPSEWYLYHTLYREARKGWAEQPFQQIAQRIRLRPDWVVGDFGCGECLLAEALCDNQVIGLDHIRWNENVLACDISSTPLEDASLDVAVFSLSLMGVNWVDYLKEAYRTLKPYGHLFIAEPAKKWQDRIGELEEAVKAVGFRIMGDVEQRYDFLYLTAVKA
jgi:SAM-dependent methyltransferase